MLDRTAPAAFLTGDERAAVWKDGKFRISLYKVLLFRHVAGAIKSGTVYALSSASFLAIVGLLMQKRRPA
jgi:hypothetical protein